MSFVFLVVLSFSLLSSAAFFRHLLFIVFRCGICFGPRQVLVFARITARARLVSVNLTTRFSFPGLVLPVSREGFVRMKLF